MDDFAGLPLHVQNALRRAGITSIEQARSLGRDGLSQVPGLGPLALGRIFSAPQPQPRQHALTTDELKRARRWFEAVQEAAPERLSEEDRRLAEKMARLVE